MKKYLREYSIITDSNIEICVLNAETSFNAVMNFDKFVRINHPKWQKTNVIAIEIERNFKFKH